ncbi:MAG: mechanosensitive ion channel family protein, partial [Acidobacteriota bacterium]
MMAKRSSQNRVLLFIFATVVVALSLYFYITFVGERLNAGAHSNLLKIPVLGLAALLGYLAVRALNAALFDLAFRLRRGYEAPTLVRNIFTLVAFTILFIIVFKYLYSDINLGALFTTSAIFGVIIGLALQDTLGNFFAGISLHADRPFQVGDVIVVGPQHHTGVVEGITWRAIKIRTFQNHIVLVSNSNAAREAIEVCPRENLNARLVYFG